MTMTLHFSPLACSLASRISLYEGQLEADLVEVDPRTKRLPDGTDYTTVHPLGLVPTLRLPDGRLLAENAAILEHLADLADGETLAPRDAVGRTALRQWLGFVSTELHKTVFTPLLDRTAPEDVRRYAVSKADLRLSHLAAHLEGRAFLLDRFSVADAYLFAVLNWAQVTPIDLRRWPAIVAYLDGLRARPAFVRAFSEEVALYQRAR
jgi:glutathione S-transferase